MGASVFNAQLDDCFLPNASGLNCPAYKGDRVAKLFISSAPASADVAAVDVMNFLKRRSGATCSVCLMSSGWSPPALEIDESFRWWWCPRLRRLSAMKLVLSPPTAFRSEIAVSTSSGALPAARSQRRQVVSLSQQRRTVIAGETTTERFLWVERFVACVAHEWKRLDILMMVSRMFCAWPRRLSPRC